MPGRGIDFVQFRFRRMRLPPLTETAERIAHEWLRPVSNNNVYLTRTDSRHPQPQRRPGGESRGAGDGADVARVNT